jgi:hypothetical protein
MFFMARLLEAGLGTKPDPVGALVLFEQAALVYPPAVEPRDTLKKKLTPEQLKSAQEALAKLREKPAAK